VLVCEDDPDVAKLIGMMLDKGGYDADMAHTAEQARDYLKMESYAAMTVDIKLPYENGLSLIRELRANKRTPACRCWCCRSPPRRRASMPPTRRWDFGLAGQTAG
jgi:DNA-binding response OmpR family regulator